MAGLIVISSATLYLIIIFLPLYAVRELGLGQTPAQVSTIIATSVEAAVILSAGWLADRIGALRLLAPACLAYALAAYPLFAHLVAEPTFANLVMVQTGAAVLLGLISGPCRWHCRPCSRRGPLDRRGFCVQRRRIGIRRARPADHHRAGRGERRPHRAGMVGRGDGSGGRVGRVRAMAPALCQGEYRCPSPRLTSRTGSRSKN
jgi:nitrate/nitrite transporter NarK